MKVTAFAPATVANVAVGFDILGFPIEGVGDTVTVHQIEMEKGQSPVLIREVKWANSSPSEEIPMDTRFNTASVGLLQMIKDFNLKFGFEVFIEKGIPLSSGMGGSAASAVAATLGAYEIVKRAGALQGQTLTDRQLMNYALLGEEVASGSRHLDNIVPCFFGGLTLVVCPDPIQVISIPVPSEIRCVLVHPHSRIETKHARSILKNEITLKSHIQQSALLGGFIAGCCQNNLNLIGTCLSDILIEPQRASLIPGFRAAKAAALQAGALGFSISGSGPSVFAWVTSEIQAETVADAISKEFKEAGFDSEQWISPIVSVGSAQMANELKRISTGARILEVLE